MKKLWPIVMLFIGFFILFPGQAFAQTDSGWLLSYSHYWCNAYNGSSAVGDINGDTFPDMVGAVNGYIYVYINNGTGNMHELFPDPVIYNGGNGESVDIGDLNGDSLNDVVVTTDLGIGVFYQNSGHTLNTMTSFDILGIFQFDEVDMKRVRVGQLNIDTDTLLDVAAGRENNMFVYLQSGGTFLPYVRYTGLTTHGGMEVAHMNNDNRPDIVGSGNNGSVSVMLQNAGGTFDAPVFYTPTYPSAPQAFAVGDLNHDGWTDVFGAFSRTGNVWYQNPTTHVLEDPYEFSFPENTSNAARVFDVDRDGYNDLVVACYENFRVIFQEADGTLGVRTDLISTLPNSTYNGHMFSVGDLNGDSWPDLVMKDINAGLFIHWGWDQSPNIVFRDPPNGVFPVGHLFYIRWGSAGIFGYVSISYSMDDGVTWHDIVNQTPNDGYYTWNAPYSVVSDECRLRIYSASAGVDRMSLRFSIEDDGVERIFVTSPNGGESLVANETHEITWYTTGLIENVRIEYSTDNAASWTEIIASTPNDGSYTWTVPNQVSSQCYVRVSDASDNTPRDSGDTPFSILAAGTEVITVTSPNGGESLHGGNTHTITWTSTGTINNVALAYSINNGNTWTNIGTMPNTGSYNWTVPSVTSTQCLVRVRDAADNDPSDQSNSTFSIASQFGASITVLSPNGGEFFFAGTTQQITWQSTTDIVGPVQIQYSTNNGSTWNNIVSSTANNGAYAWVVPSVYSSQCLIRIWEASDHDPSDVSDAVFTIAEAGAFLSLTSPNGGEYWQVGSKHDIKWTSGAAVSGSVKLEYTTNNKTSWTTIISSTANDGSYTWTVPNKPSSQCFVRISDVDGYPTNTSFSAFSIVSGAAAPKISLNRTNLYYACAYSTAAQTGIQTITVDNSGIGTLKWQASVYEYDGDDDYESEWLKIQNFSGTQSGKVEVYINPMGKSVGTYDASIMFTDANASNSPQMVNVILTVYPQQGDTNPFGFFETPADGSQVSSSIPVTGWALDDIGIDTVSLYRDPAPGEGDGEVFIGNAVLVEGLRPDVEQSYPTYPMSYKAGWGYMLLTNFLPNGGNGTYTLHAYAKDTGGHQVKLGSKTIICDNAHAVKPFGAIDTPVQGGEASGSKYRNNGWALTPMPNKIPVNGSTVKVYVDGQQVGTATYNLHRSDVASLFPGYSNSNNAGGYFDLDTTTYTNSLHTIQWVVTDNGGNADGIGSRYFSIINSGYYRDTAANTGLSGTNTPDWGEGKTRFEYDDLALIPPDLSNPIEVSTGYGLNAKPQKQTPDKAGKISLTLAQAERVVIDLKQPQALYHTAYLENRGKLQPLPPGASLDVKKGIFYWDPGPAALGNYHLVFISKDTNGNTTKRYITIRYTAL